MRRAALFAKGYPATPTFTRKSSFDISVSGGFFSNGGQVIRTAADVPNSDYAWTAEHFGGTPNRRFRQIDLSTRSFTNTYIDAPQQTNPNSVQFATEKSLYGITGVANTKFVRTIADGGDTASSTINSNRDKKSAASDGDKIWTSSGQVINISDGSLDTELAISGISYNTVFLTEYFVYFISVTDKKAYAYIKRTSERRSEADFSIGDPPKTHWSHPVTYNEYVWILSYPTSNTSATFVCWEIS